MSIIGSVFYKKLCVWQVFIYDILSVNDKEPRNPFHTREPKLASEKGPTTAAVECSKNKSWRKFLFSVPPKKISIINEAGLEVSGIIGPYHLDETVTLKCIVEGGKILF